MRRVLAFCFAAILLLSLASAQRLPGTASPDNYNLTFTPDFTRDNFSGEETIRLHLTQPASQIVLNAAEIAFGDASITSGNLAQKARVSLDKDKEQATLTVDKAIPAGPATIHITYTGILNNELRGFYLGKGADGSKYALTQFENMDARRAFPSFDEPAYKATFDIAIVADRGMTAIANSKVISDTSSPEGKHTVRFATTPKMSCYLAAFAVGNFEYIEGSAEGIPIRVYAMPGKKQLGAFALEMTEKSLRYFNRYFDIKYPYGKLDFLAVPDFSEGAMENIGFITGREAELQVDEAHASLFQKRLVATAVTHEIAHQWFGDLVTMQWWDDVWLNEGFATWMEAKPVDEYKPEWNTLLDEVSAGNILTTLGALNLDALANTRAIQQPAETPAQIVELFDGIAYGKAAAVLRMVEAYLGPETFRAGVNEYLKEHAYGNATSADFWNTLARVSHMPADRIMSSFVTQPGAPLVSLKTRCSGNSTVVNAHQQRYFYDRALLNAPNDQLWQVPICMKAPGQTQCELLTERQQDFTLPGCSKWVLANSGSGYYRSAYDADTFHRLVPDVETSLTSLQRVALISDTWAAVRVGRQPIGDYLALAEGLQSDRSDNVLRLVFQQLNFIGQNLVVEADRRDFQAWVRSALTPIANDVGWQAKSSDTDDLKNLRASLMVSLGITGEDPETIAEARKLADQALTNPASVESALATSAFVVAARSGGAALYDKLLAAMNAAPTPEQHYRYLFGLAGFSDPKLVERTLEMAVSPEVRSQDSPYLLSALIGSPVAGKQSWDFVRSRWAEVEKAGGPFAGAPIVSATGSFCDAGLRTQVIDFLAAHPVPAAERGSKQSIERIDDCVALKSLQSAPLASWLKSQGRGAGATADGVNAH